jgi:hypothetical protein
MGEEKKHIAEFYVSFVKLHHQVKRLVASGVYICTTPQYIRFAGLEAQVVYGDRDTSKHGLGFLRLHEFMPLSMRVHEAEVLDLWSCLKGKSANEAIHDYTRCLVAEVPTYGITRFAVTEMGSSRDQRRVGQDLGVSPTAIFRITDNVVLEQIRLEDLRTWNFTPKTIELEFSALTRDKYVAGTTRGREVLALLSEYQYFKRTRSSNAENVRVHYYLDLDSSSITRLVQIDLGSNVDDLIQVLLKGLADNKEFKAAQGIKPIVLLGPEFYSVRTSSRWLSRSEKLGGLRETEVWVEPRTDLHLAAEQGDLSLLRSLLGTCPLDAVDLRKDTALHLAARAHQKAAVLALLEAGANASLLNAAGQPAVGESLDLSKCGVARVPAALCKCAALRRLDLSGNQLMTIPLEFATDSTIKEVILDGNPLHTLPAHVKRGGFAEICRHLKSMSSTSQWKRLKLVVSGPEASGKSTLVAGLAALWDPKRVASMVVPTEGLSVLDLTAPSSGSAAEPDLELRVFDLSGVLAPLESLFFSRERSVHLVVDSCAAAEGVNVAELEKRVRVIRSVSDTVPILVALTHADRLAAPAAEEALTKHIKQIKALGVAGVVRVDARSQDHLRTQLQPLLASCCSTVLERHSGPVPESFRALHMYTARLADMEAAAPDVRALPPLVSRTTNNPIYEYFKAAARPFHKLPTALTWTEWEIAAADCFVPPGASEQAARFLHEIGSLLCATEEGRRLVLLDPALVARRLWELLSLRGANVYGVIPMDAIRALWQRETWDTVQLLLGLLQSLDLALTFGSRFVFVPSLLSAAEPSNCWADLKLVARHTAEWRFEAPVPRTFFQVMLAR